MPRVMAGETVRLGGGAAPLVDVHLADWDEVYEYGFGPECWV